VDDPAILVRHLTVRAGNTTLLHDISFVIPRGTFAAIIGSSGCGKTTLLRALAGQLAPGNGEVRLLGHPLAAYRQRFPLALGYLPQVSVAHDELTVAEVLRFAARLQLPATVDAAAREKWLDYLVDLAGLDDLRRQRCRTLSGGQRRRLALAETLVADPPLLLVDELTSGLDPQAEANMMRWLQFLAHRAGKTILLVTHAVGNLALTDSVMFMKQGRIVFHGNHETLQRSAGATGIEELYHKSEAELAAAVSAHAPATTVELTVTPQAVRADGPPGGLRQLATLLHRQALLLARDRTQLLLHAVLLLTFPALVAVFAIGGLPQVRNLSLQLDTNIIHSLQEQLLYLQDSLSAASLVSGLIMFQVILLTLSGANNGSREIAKERAILAKERRAGLSALAYVAGKLAQLVAFTLVQAFWMTWFVKSVCKFPGQFGAQFAILFLTTLAMGTMCLAISARSSSTERASLLAIYLVGLQLPLSGAVLALPDWLVWITRPFIAAYWGWSGYLKSLADYRIYDIVRQTTHTWLAPQGLAAAVLLAHTVVGAAVCAWLVRRQGAALA
jgi:ABC-type multidrug transport system ATPase subunit